MNFYSTNDTFLGQLPKEKYAALNIRLNEWGLTDTEFNKTLGSWLGNFDAYDKELALKLLLNIDYYSPTRFTYKLSTLYHQLNQKLYDSNLTQDDIILLTPDGGVDSSHRHLYDLSKIWQLSTSQICKLNDLKQHLLVGKALVFFNDTHGTGNQFIRDVWNPAKTILQTHSPIFIIAVTIAQQALDEIRKEIPTAYIIPDTASVSVHSTFTLNEVNRLTELGAKVYAKHPLGFGGTGLLTAYYFQCPNNSLPLIWANGLNNRVNGKGYPWNPLFPYKPKKASPNLFIRNNRTNENLSSKSKKIIVSPYFNNSDCVAKVFLHFLDQHFLEMKAAGSMRKKALAESRLATRLALLSANKVLLSASWYIESPFCRLILDEFRPLFEQGNIWLLGDATEILEYREKKLQQFFAGSERYAAYFYMRASDLPPFFSRKTNATNHIIHSWQELLSTNIPSKLVNIASDNIPNNFEERWSLIPERLGQSAFIVDHVAPLLFKHAPARNLRNELHKLINAAFFESFTKEYQCGIVTDLIYLRSPFQILTYGTSISYQKLCNELRQQNFLESISKSAPYKLFSLRDDPRWQKAILNSLVGGRNPNESTEF